MGRIRLWRSTELRCLEHATAQARPPTVLSIQLVRTSVLAYVKHKACSVIHAVQRRQDEFWLRHFSMAAKVGTLPVATVVCVFCLYVAARNLFSVVLAGKSSFG